MKLSEYMDNIGGDYLGLNTPKTKAKRRNEMKNESHSLTHRQAKRYDSELIEEIYQSFIKETKGLITSDMEAVTVVGKLTRALRRVCNKLEDTDLEKARCYSKTIKRLYWNSCSEKGKMTDLDKIHEITERISSPWGEGATYDRDHVGPSHLSKDDQELLESDIQTLIKQAVKEEHQRMVALGEKHLIKLTENIKRELLAQAKETK